MASQKNALVSGGMGGLGEAICQKLFKQGYRVIASYSPHNDNAELWLASQVGAGFNFSACMIDVADHASCEKGIGQILEDVGHIDVLVNNAGITRDAGIGKMTYKNWQLVMRTNLDSVFHMTRPVLNAMLDRQWGRIINIASSGVQQEVPGQINYAAAKAGMHGFTKSLALEVASKGITVNTVSPGYVRTQMIRRIPAAVLKEKMLSEIPLGRLGEPQEVAGLVAYLCSEEAAFLTGADIPINGGQHLY